MKHWLRIWKKVDIRDIAKSLLVAGLYKAECFNCHNIDLDKTAASCPYCGVKFKYISFRERKAAPGEAEKYAEKGLIIVDWDDFSKEYKRQKARRFLGT